MNKQSQYSDEHINAYIDGELDNDERAHLLFDEQQDTALARRINETRMLKEKSSWRIQIFQKQAQQKNV